MAKTVKPEKVAKPKKEVVGSVEVACPFKDKCFILARPDSNYCPGCKKVRKQ